MQDDFFATKYTIATSAFMDLLQSDDTWLLSLVDSTGAYKSDILSRLVQEHCGGIPFALLSLDLYTNDLGGLLTALIETPEINRLLPDTTKNLYERRSRSASVDLSRVSIRVPINLTSPNQTMESSPNARQSINADVDKALRSFERFSFSRISRSWLLVLSALKDQEKLVFLLDDYESLSRHDRKALLKILVSAHMRVKGLRVVVASDDLLDMPRTLRSLNEVVAHRL